MQSFSNSLNLYLVAKFLLDHSTTLRREDAGLS